MMLIIIALCLFLLMQGGLFSPKKASEEIPSNLLDQDISVTDSLGMAVEDTLEENMSELTFLLNNLSFERKGSQILIGVAAGLLILYLVLIGPISYIYLKRIRKMERMWFLIPGLSLLFGCLILLMSNDFVIREPYADVIKVITPGKQTVCYGVSTSPGEGSYSLYFEDKVKALQPWALADHYVINEERRSLTIRPDSAFEKDYFQFYVMENHENDFVYNIKEETGRGKLYNTTGYAFTHLMLCYEDKYCILPAMNPGDEWDVTENLWKKDEYGILGNLKEELQMHSGLSGDEEMVLNLAWYKHVNAGSDVLHIAAVSREGDVGLIETGLDLISYSLFYH
jgi:hypothetical protein